jgi:AraC-like DNA-binding protein
MGGMQPGIVWGIAVPPRPGRLPGVRMAGFSGGAGDVVELEIVPYPEVTVFVDLGDALLVEDTGGRCRRGTVVTGLAPGRIRGQGRDVQCLQVRLSPVVAHAVLRGAAELGGSVATLEDLWGRDATRLRERLAAAASWPERFALAEAAIGRRREAGRAADPEVAFAWRRMAASRGRVRVDGLAAEVGWSRQWLWSRFRAQLGLTPKRAARLIRFDHAAHRLYAGRAAAAVAAEAGYADKSHLHRDVLAFTGTTRTAVASARWLDVDDVAWPAVRPRSLPFPG